MNKFEKFLQDNDIDEAFIICAVNPTCFTCPFQFKFSDSCLKHRDEMNDDLRKEVCDDN